MEVDFVPDKYKESIKDILNFCFEGPPGHGEAFVEKVFTSENCLGSFDGDKLTALLYIYPYDIFYHGESVPMGGIGAVSTLPEYRHCKCAANMLIKSLKVMRDRGHVFSALAPFSYPFYRKFGWELGFETKKYRIPIDYLKGLGTGKGDFYPVTLDHIKSLGKLYQGFVSKYNGTIDRQRRDWEARLGVLGENRNYGYGYGLSQEDLKGYILYSINEGVFSVGEMVYDSLESKLELLRFVYYHSAQVKEMVWEAPMDDQTQLLLDNPRVEQVIVPGMMIRVIDVKKLLETYKYPSSYNGSFTIKVEDKWAPWNDGIFRLSIEEGIARVEGELDESADVECSIQSFSQIALGYIGLDQAINLGKIKINSLDFQEDLKTIFKKHPTLMTGQF